MELKQQILERLEQSEPIYCNESLAGDLTDIASKFYQRKMDNLMMLLYESKGIKRETLSEIKDDSKTMRS